jgi:hypothetical protein
VNPSLGRSAENILFSGGPDSAPAPTYPAPDVLCRS